jgi:transposase
MKVETVTRTEQIWLKGDKTIGKLCHLSKNLYNEANYIVRQELSKTDKWVQYNELNKLLKESSENYKALPAQTAQQTLILLDKSWKSFFKAFKMWKVQPEKFKERPRVSGYKKKNGEHILVFTNQQAKLRDGLLILPKKVGLKLKTRIKKGLRQVRIIPQGVGYVLEIVYEKIVEVAGKNKNRIVGIDLGSTNIVTMVNNIGERPIVVKDDGRGIKSINQYYNKRKAELQSLYDSQGIKDGMKLRRLRAKRNRKARKTGHTNSVGSLWTGAWSIR